jgi:hypothetical protein
VRQPVRRWGTMHFALIRYIALIAIAGSLGGCLETVGHPSYNHGTTPPIVNYL